VRKKPESLVVVEEKTPEVPKKAVVSPVTAAPAVTVDITKLPELIYIDENGTVKSNTA
jgi:hypothetical protein